MIRPVTMLMALMPSAAFAHSEAIAHVHGTDPAALWTALIAIIVVAALVYQLDRRRK